MLSKLNLLKQILLKAEAHISEKIVKKNYAAFKGALKAFSSILGEFDIAERWSSHPAQRPTRDVFPHTLIKPKEASGTLKERKKK